MRGLFNIFYKKENGKTRGECLTNYIAAHNRATHLSKLYGRVEVVTDGWRDTYEAGRLISTEAFSNI